MNEELPPEVVEARRRANEQDEAELEGMWDQIADFYKQNPHESEKFDTPEHECPLFMDQEDVDRMAKNPNEMFSSLQHMAQEDPPEVRAERLKDKGNEMLKEGVKTCGVSVMRYSEALAIDEVSPGLRAILFSNRAQAQIMKENYGYALQDVRWSIKEQPTVKAYYRGIKAATAVGRLEEAMEFAKEAVEKVEDLTETDRNLLAKQRKQVDAAIAAREREAERKRKAEEEKLKPQRVMAQHVADQKIGWTGRNNKASEQMAQYTGGEFLPYCEDSMLYFPMMFIYPQHSQSDFVKEVAENHTIWDHLDLMFPPNAAPAQWDSNGEYHRDKLEAHILDLEQKYHKVKVDRLMGDVMREPWFNLIGPEMLVMVTITPKGFKLPS